MHGGSTVGISASGRSDGSNTRATVALANCRPLAVDKGYRKRIGRS